MQGKKQMNESSDEEITYENLEEMLEDEDDGMYTFDGEKYLLCAFFILFKLPILLPCF